MKTFAFLFAFLIILSSYALANDDEIYDSTYLVLDSGLSANLEIEKEPGSVIDYIECPRCKQESMQDYQEKLAAAQEMLEKTAWYKKPEDR